MWTNNWPWDKCLMTRILHGWNLPEHVHQSGNIKTDFSQCKGYVSDFKSSERSEHLKALTATISESLRTFSGLGVSLALWAQCLFLSPPPANRFHRQVQRWLCDTGSLSRHRASFLGHSNGPRDEHRIQTMFRIFTLFFLKFRLREEGLHFHLWFWNIWSIHLE